MSLAAFGNGLTIPNGTAGAISVDSRMTGAAAGWSGFTQMAFGSVASQLVGSMQTGWPLAVFWFMAAASMLALLTHWLALTSEGEKRDSEELILLEALYHETQLFNYSDIDLFVGIGVPDWMF